MASVSARKACYLCWRRRTMSGNASLLLQVRQPYTRYNSISGVVTFAFTASC